MRRKVGLLVAFTLVIVMSVAVLAGCGLKSIDSFIEQLDKTKNITIDVTQTAEKTEIVDGKENTVTVTQSTVLFQCDSVNIFTRSDDKVGERVMEQYIAKDGKKIMMYTRQFSTKILAEEDKEGIAQQEKEKNTWYKQTVTAEDYAKALDTKTQVAKFMVLDKSLYDVKEDGMWVLKADNKVTLALEGKNLVRKVGNIITKARTTKLYITTPSGIRDAIDMPADKI